MSRLVRRGDLVFDVGANRGDVARSLLSAGARVVCVEPQPHCVATLQARYGSDVRCAIVAAGLGATEGRLTLSICSESDVLSTFTEAWKQGRFADKVWDQHVEVEIRTLDGLIAEFGTPRYCKIDVEGYELEVLRGLSQPIPFVSIEYAAEGRSATLECLRRLEALGYRAFNATRGDGESLVHGTWISADQLVGWLDAEAARDAVAWGDVYASMDAATTVRQLPRRGPQALSVVLQRLRGALARRHP